MKEAKPLKTNKKSDLDIASMYTPVTGHIVIRNKVRSKTPSGIIIPENQRTGDAYATVVAVPEGESPYVVGDIIMLKPRGAEIVHHDRMTIAKEYMGEVQMYYVHINNGAIMAKVTEEFIKLTEQIYDQEEKEEKEIKSQPKILVPPSGIIMP